MKNLSLLIKPASSLCNMHCKYCFYADIASSREIASYGIMSQETVYQILTTTKKDLLPGDHLTIATVYKGIHIKKQNNGLPTY